MKSARLLSVALLSLTAWPALAVNKCINELGQVVYQNAPCPSTSTGSPISINSTPVPAGNSPAQEDEMAKVHLLSKTMERERKLREIDLEIERLERRILDHRSTMRAELAALEQKKTYANNNLAGATWEQSISQEMNAVAQKYDSLIRSDQNQIDFLRKDAERLRKTAE